MKTFHEVTPPVNWEFVTLKAMSKLRILYTRLIFWKCFPNIPFCPKKFSYNQSQTAQDNRNTFCQHVYYVTPTSNNQEESRYTSCQYDLLYIVYYVIHFWLLIHFIWNLIFFLTFHLDIYNKEIFLIYWHILYLFNNIINFIINY